MYLSAQGNDGASTNPSRSSPVKQTGLSESFTNDSVFSCLHILKLKKYEATERKQTGAGLYRASVSLIVETEMDPCWT